MAKRARESAVGDANSDRRAFPTATSRSSRMRQRMPDDKQQQECNKITAAIPTDIVGDVLKRMNPKEAVRLSSVCRCWRAPAFACSPTLAMTPWMLSLRQSANHLHFRLQSVADDSVFVDLSSVNAPPDYVRCIGSYHGWLILRQGLLKDHPLLLFNPFSRVWISLPPYPGLWKVLCITSDPAAPGCAVSAYDFNWNLLVCRPRDDSWTEGAGVCRIRKTSRAVWLKEQLFVLDHITNQLFILQLFPLRCKDIRQVRFSYPMKCTDLFLVASHGDLLLFDMRIGRRTLFVVSRLHCGTMTFVEVKSLGADRAVFLGDGGAAFSVSAREAGCGADCIYFSDSDCYRLWDKSSSSWVCCSLKERREEVIIDRHADKIPNFGKFWITPTMKNNYSNFLRADGYSKRHGVPEFPAIRVCLHI